MCLHKCFDISEFKPKKEIHILYNITSNTACIRVGKNTSSFTNHTNKIFCNYRKSVELSSRWRTLYQDMKKYHEIRGGLTQEPITEDDLRMICPLHALMRGEGIVQKLIFHRDSRQLYGQIRWKSFGEFSKMYQKAKENPREVIYR